MTSNPSTADQTGIAISVLGGLSSLLMGFLFPLLFTIFDDVSNLFFQIILCAGGVITIIGAIVAASDPGLGRIIVMIGGIVGGGNIITLMGATRISFGYIKHVAIQQSVPTVDKPVHPESTIGWIIARHSKARVEGHPIPSWEQLSLMYKEEFGTAPSAGQMERLFATWQKIKEKKQALPHGETSIPS